VLAKAAFLLGADPGAAYLAERGVAGLLVGDDGTLIRTPKFACSEWPKPAKVGAL
jgi:hypothetical protein